jgi:hypothetical protein
VRRVDRSCDECGVKLLLCMLWDAYYCDRCNRWREDVCDDAACRFCTERPKRPYAKRAETGGADA